MKLPDSSSSVLLALLVLTGCSGSSGEPASASPAARSPAAVVAEKSRVGGQEAIESALAAQKGHACLLNFWATWCPPCVAELPDLMAVVKEHEGQALRVIGASLDEMVGGTNQQQALEKVDRFLAERGLDLPTTVVAKAEFDKVDATFGLADGIPVTLAYDASGKLVDRQVGLGSRERFEEMVKKALGAKAR